ncbi:MAG: aldo/keto reductase, partial [Bacteroidota bacterium]|nr:aldo/keto reductase [Bacteroidota bacterium]
EILKCFDQGNELLGGRYQSDIVSVHDPDEYLHAASDPSNRAQRFQEILESYRALFDLKKQGKVKAVGIGSKDWIIIRELYEHVPFDWVMIAASYTVFSHPEELVQFMDKLKEDNVGIINSAVFHGGFLSGGEKFDYQYIDPDSSKGKIIYPWRKAFNSICQQHGLSPADVCLHFGLSHPAIVSLALNTSKSEKMNRNVEILNNSIPASFWNALKNNLLMKTNFEKK